jgi:ArsR family transcriptional regulator
MDKTEQVTLIKKQFAASRRLLTAIGDETRQAILAALMETNCDGMRVGEITEQTHLSRPAVSHHLKTLLDAGMVGVSPEGTKNFYWLRLGDEWDEFVALISNIEKLRVLGGTCDE